MLTVLALVLLSVGLVGCVAVIWMQNQQLRRHSLRIARLEGGLQEFVRPAAGPEDPSQHVDADRPQQVDEPRPRPRPRPAAVAAVPANAATPSGEDVRHPPTAPISKAIDTWQESWADQELRRFHFRPGHRPGDTDESTGR